MCLSVAACAAVLAGCGSLHPGEAATVGDTVITEDQLADSTEGFCELLKAAQAAQGGGNASLPLRIASLNAANQLILGAAIDDLAAKRDLTLSDSEVDEWMRQLPFDLDGVPEDKAEAVDEITRRLARNTLLTAELGRIAFERDNPGQQPEDPQALQERGSRVAQRHLAQLDPETNPRYGNVLNPQQANPGTGSLSQPVSDEAKEDMSVPGPTSELPEDQMCP